VDILIVGSHQFLLVGLPALVLLHPLHDLQALLLSFLLLCFPTHFGQFLKVVGYVFVNVLEL
jgi:hypothetical protein